MHDAVSLELLGRATAILVTTEFVHEAAVQGRALGMPDLAPIVIDHPLSTLSEAEIAARAEQAVPQCLARWRGL